MTRTLSLSLFKHVDCSDGDVIFAEHRELERALLLLEQRHALLVGTKKHPVHLLQSVSDLDASILLRGTQGREKKKKKKKKRVGLLRGDKNAGARVNPRSYFGENPSPEPAISFRI